MSDKIVRFAIFCMFAYLNSTFFLLYFLKYSLVWSHSNNFQDMFAEIFEANVDVGLKIPNPRVSKRPTVNMRTRAFASVDETLTRVNSSLQRAYKSTTSLLYFHQIVTVVSNKLDRFNLLFYDLHY